jgi:hypothetical protein
MPRKSGRKRPSCLSLLRTSSTALLEVCRISGSKALFFGLVYLSYPLSYGVRVEE